MSRGLCAFNARNENPSLSSAPGRKFSVSTSAFFSSLRTSSRPSGFCRSTARLFLLRLNTGKNPAPAASRRRVLSPASGSTLITSAPRSASTSPQEGPITMCANSTTRTSSSGSTKSLGQSCERRVAVDRLFRNGLDENFAGLEKLVQRDAGPDAHALEHEHEILGDHVAACAGGERTAAEAAHRAVEVAYAFLVGGERVGETEPTSVVQVRGLELRTDFTPYLPEQSSDLRGIGVSHGVGEADEVAELGKRYRDAHYVVFGHFALHGAAEGGGNRTFNLDASMWMLRALAYFLDHLLRRHAHVRFAVQAARGHGKGHLVRARFERALEAFEVGRKGHDLDVAKRFCKGDNVSGVGHRRDEPRRHERADFDLFQAGRCERGDPGFLRLGGHQVLCVLQSVAGAYFANVYFPCQGLSHGDLILVSIMPIAMPHATEPAANASSAQRLASQPPKRVAINARASGPRNWPICDACMTIPLPVPMCCGVRAWTGMPEKTDAGMTPAKNVKASIRL